MMTRLALALLLVLFALPSAAQGPLRLRTTLPPGTVEIRAGSSIQAAINANPINTTFYLRAGTYRLTTPLAVKTGNTFIGERDANTNSIRRAVISGGRILTGWIPLDGRWYVTGQTQQGDQGAGIGDCAETTPGSGIITHPRCFRPEDLFFDSTQQKYHEDALADVGPGEYFFDYAAQRIYVGDDPTGHVVETSVVPSLFTATSSNVDYVTLRGLVIEKFASPTTSGTVNLCDGTNGSEYWIAEDNEIRYNHGAGISTYPFLGCMARRNFLHHNCSYAFVGSGENIVIEGNTWAYNNLVAQYTPAANTAVDESRVCGINDYNGAVFKFTFSINARIRDNVAYQNKGIAIWLDIQNTGGLIERNHVSWNHLEGIFYEISCNGVIRRNHVNNNGTAQDFPGWVIGGIEVATSSNVEVYENRLEDNWQQIAALHDFRRGPTGMMLCPTYELRDLNVHDNHITSTQSPATGGYGVGLIDAPGAMQSVEAFGAGFNNHFENNTYLLTGSPTLPYFRWNNGDVSDSTWQVTYGHDDTGSITR